MNLNREVDPNSETWRENWPVAVHRGAKPYDLSYPQDPDKNQDLATLLCNALAVSLVNTERFWFNERPCLKGNEAESGR